MREKPYMTVLWMDMKFEHFPGENPYKEGTLHWQMHEQFDENLWKALGGPEAIKKVKNEQSR